MIELSARPERRTGRSATPVHAPTLRIDLSAVAANTRRFVRVARGEVKADGFGHGLADVARTALTIALPDDLPNLTYAALIRGLQGVLHAAGLSPRSTIYPDPYISDAELNSSFIQTAEYDPWAP